MKIMIYNIGTKVTADSLAAIFAPYGQVASSVLLPAQQTDLGMQTAAIVFMPDAAKASRAAKQLDGCIVDGQVLKVGLAQPTASPSIPGFSKRFPFLRLLTQQTILF